MRHTKVTKSPCEHGENSNDTVSACCTGSRIMNLCQAKITCQSLCIDHYRIKSAGCYYTVTKHDENSHSHDDALHKVRGAGSKETAKGGTLRLGAYPCVLQDDTVIKAAYGRAEISERHRHRYEFNNDYREALQNAGLTLSGLSPDGNFVETVELSNRDFYVGVQYHPESIGTPTGRQQLKNFLEGLA